MKHRLDNLMKRFEKHTAKAWYPYALASIALIDYFIIFVPMVPLLVTSIFTAPKRWFSLSLWTAIGSGLGALLFAFIVSHYGIDLLQAVAPKMLVSAVWQRGEVWLSEYGYWALFAFAVLPISDHPIIAIASLTKLSLTTIGMILILAKFIKFCTFGYMASHTPWLLNKVLGNKNKPKPQE